MHKIEKTKLVITAKKIFNGIKFVENVAILIRNNKIESVSDLSLYSKKEIIDYGDAIISCGFVDLQLNGCGGILFNDDTSTKALAKMHETNLRFGTTNFLPTLITTDLEQIKKAIEVCVDYRNQNTSQNGIIYGGVMGLHIEGPFISLEKKGIHNEKYIKPLNQEAVNILVHAAKKIPIKLTLAPEVNDINLIKQLISGGVMISIGHSNASYNKTQEVIKAGASLATHLFNAMSPLEGRSPGVVGAVLNNDIYSGIIADGHHVDYNSINLVHKIKNDKLYIVTDAVTPMGTNIKEFAFAGQTIFVKEGKCVNVNGTLGGANIDMLSSLANLVRHCNIPLVDALKMSSTNAIKALKNHKNITNRVLGGVYGKVSKTYSANLSIFDFNFKLIDTINNGIIYKN
jgi:N-acetylglucosamine-6-phosphate deacetylase